MFICLYVFMILCARQDLNPQPLGPIQHFYVPPSGLEPEILGPKPSVISISLRRRIKVPDYPIELRARFALLKHTSKLEKYQGLFLKARKNLLFKT